MIKIYNIPTIVGIDAEENMTCTFFGHSCFSGKLKYKIKGAITNLILNHNVDTFYVGNHGNFDTYTISVLKELKEQYPQIKYYIVYAYLPTPDRRDIIDASTVIMFDGFEKVPRKYAISYRNKWMIEKSDFVISYITCENTTGGAAQFAELAKRKDKTVINIAKE